MSVSSSSESRFFLLWNRNLLLLWIGQITSACSARLYQMVLVWWIISGVEESGGARLGIFLLVSALPSLLLAGFIGRRIDLLPSKKILVSCDGMAAVLLALFAFGLFHNKVGFLLAVLTGLLSALLQAWIDPTLNKALGEVVNEEHTQKGVALLSSTQSLASFGGAIAGALLIDWIGMPQSVLVGAAGYFIAVICTSLVRFTPVTSLQGASSGEQEASEVLGFYPDLRRILYGFGFVNFFVTPTLVVLPLYAKTMLLGSASTVGRLEAALSLGILLGIFLVRPRGSIAGKVSLASVCLFLMAAAFLVPGIFVSEAVYFLALLGVGAGLGLINVNFLSLFQQTVRPEHKGRFFARLQAVISLTFPLGYLCFGFLSEGISAAGLCVVQAFGTALMAGYFGLLGGNRVAPLVEEGAL